MVLRCGGGAAALPTAWRVQGSVRSRPSLLLQTHSHTHTHTLTLTLTLSPQRTQMWERSTSTFQMLAPVAAQNRLPEMPEAETHTARRARRPCTRPRPSPSAQPSTPGAVR